MHLGEPAAQVRAAFGLHGVCSGCAHTTWYFTYGKFQQQGLAVELTGGRVSGAYTLWQPQGWRSLPSGLALGAVEGQVTALAGTMIPVACPGYIALARDGPSARTVYYIVGGKLWGFGLFRRAASPCR